MKLSVCLPTYNRVRYLEQTIASLLDQTFTDFELIVSDNCSTDGTRALVEGVRDPRLRYVRNDTNVGHYRNMNRCLDLAAGEHVCIVHDDDVYAGNFLARESALLDAHPSMVMVHCAVWVVDAERRRLRVLRAYPRTRVLAGRREFVHYLGGHNVCCSTVMFRRALWPEVGPFEHDLMCADWLMWMAFALQGDIGYIAEPLVEMRVHGATMSGSMDPERWYREAVEICDRGVARLKQAWPDATASRARLVAGAARAQGRRFFIAALSAAAQGAHEEAARYVEVLRKLEGRGWPRWCTGAARVLTSRAGRMATRPVRAIRRTLGRVGT